jgi:hypothetical protein
VPQKRLHQAREKRLERGTIAELCAGRQRRERRQCSLGRDGLRPAHVERRHHARSHARDMSAQGSQA